MKRVVGIAGWLVALAYFGMVAAFNVGIIGELLHLPPDFEPGWRLLIECDALYGGGGVVVVLLVRLVWRRWLSRAPVGHPLPS